MGNSYAFSDSLELDDSPYALEDTFQFKFDDWLQMNNLTDFKQLFIKHNMIKPSALSITSNAFKNMMHDKQLLSKPDYIPKIIDALHTLHAQQESNHKRSPRSPHLKPQRKRMKSFIFDEDDEIFNEIQKNLDVLHSVKVNINEINIKHPNNEWYVQQARSDQSYDMFYFLNFCALKL